MLENRRSFGDPKGHGNFTTAGLLLASSASSSSSEIAPANGGNVDRVLFKNLVEMVPLVESLMDRRANSSFTRRASVVYTPTPAQLRKVSLMTSNMEEVRSIRATQQNKHETFTFDELREVYYLHATISESLKLYPPVPIDTQSCLDGDVNAGRDLRQQGMVCDVQCVRNGGMESVGGGENCMEYMLKKWLEDGVFRRESPYRFPVFHAKPRMCLGKEMAYIHMKSFVASVVERFEIEVVEGSRTPEPLLSLTMRMKGGLHVRVRESSLC